jgi:hypothetical protein
MGNPRVPVYPHMYGYGDDLLPVGGYGAGYVYWFVLLGTDLGRQNPWVLYPLTSLVRFSHSIVSLPQRCGMERISIALMRVKALINCSLVINLVVMFSYPPCPWILSCDNVVLVLPGSPAIPSAIDMDSGMKTMLTTEYVAIRSNCLIELRPWVADH